MRMPAGAAMDAPSSSAIRRAARCSRAAAARTGASAGRSSQGQPSAGFKGRGCNGTQWHVGLRAGRMRDRSRPAPHVRIGASRGPHAHRAFAACRRGPSEARGWLLPPAEDGCSDATRCGFFLRRVLGVVPRARACLGARRITRAGEAWHQRAGARSQGRPPDGARRVARVRKLPDGGCLTDGAST